MKHTLLSLFALLCTTFTYAQDFQVNGIYYDRLGGDSVEVTCKQDAYGEYFYYNTYSGAITIPTSITTGGVTYRVTGIGYNAFGRCTNLTSVILPNSITKIDTKAFSQCAKLTSIKLPSSLITIGGNAFIGCGFSSIVIPENVLTIGSTSFGDCTKLTSVTVKANGLDGSKVFTNSPVTSVTYVEGITEIGSLCSGMESLNSVTIPESVITIGASAFNGCIKLSSVKIPKNVTTIGNSAFEGCIKLSSINLPDKVVEIGNYAFERCSSLSSIVLPENLRKIGKNAFDGCVGLTSITIPTYVTSIGNAICANCTNLKEIIWNAKKCGNFGSNSSVFSSSSVEIFTFGDSVEYIPSYLCQKMENLKLVNISSNVKEIGVGVFNTCVNLTSVQMEDDGVNIIGDDVFINCSSLEGLIIPKSVTKIGDSVFENCLKLKSLIIPSGVLEMGTRLFYGCTSLVELTVSADNPLYYSKNNCILYTRKATLGWGCKTSVIPIDGTVTEIAAYAFAGCTELSSITLPNTITRIDNYAFLDCSKLTTLNIPETVTTVGTGAFMNCELLQSVEILNKLSLGSSVFESCTSLTTITLPDNLTSIATSTFENCTALASIDIPSSVTSIGNSAFLGCSKLTAIVLPAKLSVISASAFKNSGLISVTSPSATPPTIYADAFPQNALIIIPCGSSKAYWANATWAAYPYYEERLMQTLTLTTSREDLGTVRVLQEPISCEDLTAIFEAVPADDCCFVNWSDGNKENPRTIQLVEDKNYTANFDYIITGMTLDHTAMQLNIGESVQVLVDIQPTNVLNKQVTWQTDNSAVVTVSTYYMMGGITSGLVRARGNGTATITATTKDGKFTAQCVVTVTTPVSSIALDKTSLDLFVDSTHQLNATVYPTTASNQNIRWTTDKAEVATVENGIVKAVGNGTATITATSEDGDFTETCVVTVTTPVKGIALDKDEVSLLVGNTHPLTATVLPLTATNQNINWTTDNATVAMVDRGIVRALGNGTAVITATTEDGGFTAQCAITVTTPVQGVMLDQTELSLLADETHQLTAMVLPTNASNQRITWASNNTAVATVEDGLVKAVGNGRAIITVTTEDGNYVANCVVVVTTPTEGVTLDAAALSLVKGEAKIVKAIVAPTTASNQNVVWTIANEDVAIVSGNGLVIAMNNGTTTLTATTEEGGFTAQCAITVTTPVSGIELDKNVLELLVGNTHQLTTTIYPATASEQTITWRTDNAEVATVANGLVTAIGNGTATITATTADGTLTATCVVLVTTPAKGIALDKTALALLVGSTQQLKATIVPTEATNRKITWHTSDASVAIVDDGFVKALGNGTATITATADDGGFTAQCVVTVTTPVQSILLDKAEIALSIAETYQLNAMLLPTNATNQRVAWSSNNTSVATVENGLVKAVGNGVAIITATTEDGHFMANCVVVVKGDILVSSIVLDQTSLSLSLNETHQLHATLLPTNATNQRVAWSSNNTSVATVENGLVKAVGNGQAMITVTSEDGHLTATCIVVVTTPIADITLNPTQVDLYVGDMKYIQVHITPTTATLKKVIWSSNNAQVVTVDNGVVEAVGIGTAMITATTEDGSRSATCTITVHPTLVKRIVLDAKDLSLEVGDTARIQATVVPEVATNKHIVWTSNNPTIATVVNGLVTAHSVGMATITATSEDGQASASCSISVTEHIAVVGITLQPEEVSMTLGSLQKLVATILPEDATNPTVCWSISNADVALVENGWIIPLAEGNATITATTEDGNYSATCLLTVSKTQEEETDTEPERDLYKILENGIVYIIHKGERYTLDGREAKP